MEVDDRDEICAQKILRSIRTRWPQLAQAACMNLARVLNSQLISKKLSCLEVLGLISAAEAPEDLCDSLGLARPAGLQPVEKEPSEQSPTPAPVPDKNVESLFQKLSLHSSSSSTSSSSYRGGRGGAARDRVDAPRSDVCYKFQSGSCRRGGTCKFSHTKLPAGFVAPRHQPSPAPDKFESSVGVIKWLRSLENNNADGSSLLAALLYKDGARLESFLSCGQWLSSSSVISLRGGVLDEIFDTFLRIATREDITTTAVLGQKVAQLFATLHAESSAAFWVQLEKFAANSTSLVNFVRLERICTLCEQMMIRHEDSFRLLGNLVEALEMYAHIHPLEFQNRVTALQTRRKEARLRFTRKEALLARAAAVPTPATQDDDGSANLAEVEDLMEQDYVDFRTASIIPSTATFLKESATRRYLRPNRVKDGSEWRGLDDYLSINFILLREDCLRELRENIAKIQSAGGSDRVLQQLRDVSVYYGVRLHQLRFTRDAVIYRVCIDRQRNKKYNWARCKRLLTGSLVALSSDNFQEEILWATVAARNIKDLEASNMIDLEFAVGADNALSRAANKVYVMVESKTYFEAYSHMMKALQVIQRLPFQDTILSPSLQDIEINTAEPDESKFRLSVNPPKYVQQRPLMDFKALDPRAMGGVNVLAPEWPHLDCSLDESQLKSLKHILTSEVALVQGPPGTGKTYVGKLATRIILDSSKSYESTFGPILCVTYTNHALDQFLSGIMQFEPNIVRVGGRCSDTGLLKKTLFALGEKRAQLSGPIAALRYETLATLGKLETNITNRIQVMSKEIISLKHISLLNLRAATELNSIGARNAVRIWLGVDQPPLARNANTEPVIEDAVELEPEPEADEDEIREIEDSHTIEGLDDVDLWGNEDDESNKTKKTQRNVVVLQRDGGDDEGDWPVVDAKQEKDNKKEEKPVAYPLSDYYDEKTLPPYDPAWEFVSVWDLDLHRRRALYKHWKAQLMEEARQELEKLSGQYSEACATLKGIRDNSNLEILRKARVIGMTTTGAAKSWSLIQALKPRVVIVEEAAEVLEASIITSISQFTEHLILIGDHQQLRPSTAVFDMSKKYHLDVSLFERLIKCGLPYTQLATQRRMRSDIAKLISPIYPHLQSHPSVDDYPLVRGLEKSLFFMTHDKLEAEPNKRSKHHSNVHEARMIKAFSRYLLQQTYKPHQITILTPYADQLLLLKDTLKAAQSLPGLGMIRVTTIDNYQGEENDIIILSLVRSNNVGSIGFLRTPNRVTVALSRAKHGFFIFGNAMHLSKNSTFWDSVAHYLHGRSCIGPALRLQCLKHPERKVDVEAPEDFERHAIDGGCKEMCGERMNCGHTCPKHCHPVSHDEVLCYRPCARKFERCGHGCPKLCYQECGSCETPVLKLLPKCGHTINVSCSVEPDKAWCNLRCERKLPCGHICDKLCGDNCQTKCRAKIPVVMPDCQHTIEVECWQYRDIKKSPVACTHKCGRPLVCSHSCGSNCCKTNSSDGNCPPCLHKCENSCVHNKCGLKCGDPCVRCIEPCAWVCEHKKCSQRCSDPCDREPCNEPCKKRIHKCGHQCIGLCGEPCPKFCRICDPDEQDSIFMTALKDFDETDRFVQLDCGHIFQVSGIDQWLKQSVEHKEAGAIKLPSCPNCKSPVRRTLRYGPIIKAVLAHIEAVKPLVLYGKLNGEAKIALEDKRYHDCMTKSLASLRYCVTVDACSMFVKAAQMAGCIDDALRDLQNLTGSNDSSAILTALALLFSSASRREQAMTRIQKAATMVSQELRNGSRTRNHLENATYVAYGLHTLDEITPATEMVELVLKLNPRLQMAIDLLNDIKAMKVAIDVFQKTEHVRAGGWYRCPNGHPYAIGECGGAMQTSHCPDCGVAVGGSNHTLLSSNTHASVDGSQHPAWSDQNNLANFDLADL